LSRASPGLSSQDRRLRKPVIIRLKGAQGNEFREIVPADLIFERSPDVVPLGMSSLLAKQSGFQVLRDAIMMFSSNPMFSQFLKVLPAMQEICRMLDIDPDQFVNDADAMAAQKMPQEWENLLMTAGVRVPINPADDDQAHIEELNAFIADDEKLSHVPEANHALFQEHLKLHMDAIAAKASAPAGMPSVAAPASNVPPGPQVPGGMAGVQGSAPAAGQPAPQMQLSQMMGA
jgi:hypothetical protein